MDMYRQLKGDVRVLHCPENLGNNAKLLSDYEKKQGIHSWSISLRKEAFGFVADQTLVNSGSFLLGELARWRLLWIALRHFDVIHFNNGKTIMPHRVPFKSVKKRTNVITAILYSIYAYIFEGLDLPILRAFGKDIYVTVQGSDARLSTHYTQRHKPQILAELNPDYLSPIADRYKKNRISKMEKYATSIFCLNPDLLRNFSAKAKFLPYYNIDTAQIKPHAIFDNDSIHIVHAPSKRDIKGTKYILEAIANIQKNDSRIKFTLVENLSNQDAQKVYDRADLFIDQLIVGWYGGVAVEVMARGVPVLCFLDFPLEISDTKLHDIKSNIPIINTSIETIERDLTNLLKNDKSVVKEIGDQSRIFVDRMHRLSL
jgi:glycosyltransferase involved in cell wall biosynthesis